MRLPSSLNFQGVYSITCRKNQCVYIGSSGNLVSRFQTTLSTLRAGIHTNKRLQYDWNKYGEKQFVFSVLLLIKGKKQRLKKEAFFCNFYTKRGINIYNHHSPYKNNMKNTGSKKKNA